MHDLCYDVEVEPALQMLEGESFYHNSTSTDDNARIDNRANGLWGSRFSRIFSDVKNFNPWANPCSKEAKEAHKYHEAIKNLKYQRILENEKRNFVPLVFSCVGRRVVCNTHYEATNKIENKYTYTRTQ